MHCCSLTSIRSYDSSCLVISLFLSFAFVACLTFQKMFQLWVLLSTRSWMIVECVSSMQNALSHPKSHWHVPPVERQHYNLINECSLFSSCRCCMSSTRALSNANVSALTTSASSSTRALADAQSLLATTKASPSTRTCRIDTRWLIVVSLHFKPKKMWA